MAHIFYKNTVNYNVNGIPIAKNYADGGVMHFSKILCAIDCDPLADSVFETGCELAEKFGAELALVSIFDVALLNVGESGILIADLRTSIDNEIKRLFARLLKKKKMNITTFTEEGNPSKSILGIAACWNADLILIATHGRKGLNRVLMGSVAESVTRNSKCPVLIIPSPH